MKRYILLLLACLLFASDSLAGKNAIYRGSMSQRNVLTGQSTTVPIYLIFGEELSFNGSDTRHCSIKAQMIGFNGIIGRKTYTVLPVDSDYRTIEYTKTDGRKTAVFEIITRSMGGRTTYNGGSFDLEGTVLTGKHTSLKYRFPVTLAGTLLVSSGWYVEPGAEGQAGALVRGSYRLKLVHSLTDPIPDNEPIALSTKRVTDYLQSIGFVEYVQ